MSVIGAEIQETEIFASLPWRSQDAREFSYYKGRWMRPKFETYDSQEQIELCLNCPFSEKEYLRQLSRLAGLLEIADDAFCQIRISIDDYRRRVKQVVKNGKFEEIELNGDSYSAYVENGAFDMLNKRIASISNMEVEDVPLESFLPVFKSFGLKTLKQLDDFKKNYSDLAYEFSVRQFAGKDIDIISSVTGPLALCVVFIVSKDMGENIVKMLLDRVYGERKTNERMAIKLTNIAKSMGLVKSGEDANE